MAVYYPGCPEVQVAPTCSDCPPKENGDIRSVFIVEEDFTFVDITDTSEWTTAIMAKDVYVFPYTRGSLEMTPTETPGFGDRETELDGYSFVLNFMDPQYLGDAQFWDGIKNSKRWRAGYRTETLVHLASVNGTIIPTQPVAEDKKSAVNWAVKIMWSQDNVIIPNTTPTGVFDQCIQPA